jgi:fructose-1,6-bisphosphatase/inositol monophosphatase family enzyme
MLALPYVAAGHIAGAIYAAGASPVHRAAGLLLAEEAGARITDAQGHPWQLNSPVVVLAASAELHAQLLAVATS